MDTLSSDTLLSLLNHQTAPCVSIYTSTHPSGPERKQDRVRLKNVMQLAENQLVAGGMSSSNANNLLSPLRDLMADTGYWQKRGHGLAAFISQDTFHCFRLPRTFEEQSIVHSRFFIKPLLPLLADLTPFFILALSQNSVRLFEASRFQIRQLGVKNLPGKMKEVLNYTSVDRGSQVHPAMKGSGGLGKQAVVFHGQGGEADTHKEELKQFIRQVDAAIHPVVSAKPAPLLLAGAAYLLAIYRRVSNCPGIAEEQLEGNCDYLTPHDILERAMPLIEAALKRNRETTRQRYSDLATSKTSNDVRQIVLAALDGRVNTLFVDCHAQIWGNLNTDHTVEIHQSRQDGDDDLIDLAAAQTLLHRGTVYSMDSEQMPEGHFAAALLRH